MSKFNALTTLSLLTMTAGCNQESSLSERGSDEVVWSTGQHISDCAPVAPGPLAKLSRDELWNAYILYTRCSDAPERAALVIDALVERGDGRAMYTKYREIEIASGNPNEAASLLKRAASAGYQPASEQLRICAEREASVSSGPRCWVGPYLDERP